MRGRRQGLGSYTLGDRYITPDRRLSQMLMRQGSRGGPSDSWQETLGRIAQQLSGAYIGKLDQDKQDIANQAFAKVEPDSFRPPTDAEAMATPGMRDLELSAMTGIAGDGRGQMVTAPLPDDQLMQQGGIPGTLDKISRYNAGLSGDSNRSTDDIMEDQVLNAGIDLQAQNFQDEMEQRRAASNVPRSRDFKAELAQGMQGYQQDPNNRVMNEKMPQLEYAMQNLRGLENNPYAQRLLQGLMMNKMSNDAASRLDATARERQLADAERKREQTIEDRKFGKRPTRTKRSATQGLAYDETFNPETGMWDRGEDYDPNLVSEKALGQKTTIKGAETGQETGPFKGKSLPGQEMNILLSPNADTSSPLYHAAYAERAKPQIYTDPTTQQQRIVTPDMRMYPTPTDLNPASTWSPFAVQAPTQKEQLQGKGLWEPIDYSQHGGIPGSNRPVGTPTISAQEGPTGRTKDYNEFQSKSGGFYSRMLDSKNTIDDLYAGPDHVGGTADDLKGKDVFSNWEFMKNSVPGIGNYLASDNFQKGRQAMRNWVTANLRLESGAAIPPEELENEYIKWFPVFGDREEVVKQKRKAREIVEENMRIQSQGAWESEFKPVWEERLKTQKQKLREAEEGLSGLSLDKPLGAGEFKLLPDGRIVRKERRGR